MRTAAFRPILGLVVVAVMSFGLAHDLDLSVAHAPEHSAAQAAESHQDGVSPHTGAVCALLLIVVSLARVPVEPARDGRNTRVDFSPGWLRPRFHSGAAGSQRPASAFPGLCPMLA